MRHFFTATTLLLVTACTSGVVPPPKAASTYFQEGESFFEKGLYEDAIASWEKVRDSYYSPELNIQAEMKIAEAQFLAGNYLEAALAYEEFLKQHPGNENTDKILYQLGMSYFKQMLSSDRDQTVTRNALATFTSLLQRYPEDSRKDEVREMIALCRGRLAEHELYIGRFYLKYGHPEAAIQRLRSLFSTYPEFGERDQAYFLLGQAYLKANRDKDAIEAFNTLYREFPNSKYITPAQKILAKHY
jgi:outer membrane protein assembly factor BamD